MTKRGMQIICSMIMASGILLAVLPAHAVELQWFGQSAFKITSPGGKVILIDPFISKNPKTPKEHKDLSKLGKIDLMMNPGDKMNF